MKKTSLLTAIFCLLLSAGAAFAQQPKAAVNFAGSWELDTAKSKLPERMRVESGNLTVTQTDKNLTIVTDFKRAPRPEGAMMPPSDGNNGGTISPPAPDGSNRGMRQGNGTGGGIGRGGVMGSGNGAVTYSLDGRETTMEAETPNGAPPAKTTLVAKMEKDGKLKLVSMREFDSPMGSVSIKTTEIWELTDGGKTLKVMRETETPRGSQTAEMYFGRKILSVSQTTTSPIIAGKGIVVADGELVDRAVPITDAGADIILKGEKVLNFKALKLVPPTYPPAARAVRASGAVLVKVTIDENGNIVSADAISGHPLLRAASEEAACKAKFAPTLLEGKPIKVTGVIVYNFVP